jgi:hypothetical protein
MADKDFEFPNEDEYAGMVFEDAGELTVNLADVKEMKFENIPKGTYLAEVDECTYGMSKTSGSPMLSFRFRIIEGQYADRKLPFWLSFSAKALPGTKANLNRLAPELISQAFKPRELADQGYFHGKLVRIRVDVQEYQGEMRNNIRGLLAAGAGSGNGFLAA